MYDTKETWPVAELLNMISPLGPKFNWINPPSMAKDTMLYMVMGLLLMGSMQSNADTAK